MNKHSIIVSNPAEIVGLDPSRIIDGVIVKSLDGNHGTITVSVAGIMEPGNYVSKKNRRVGFIAGPLQDMRGLVASKRLTPGCDLSVNWRPCRLIVREQLVPFYGPTAKNPTRSSQLPKSIAIEGSEERRVLTSNGQPIFRQTFLVPNESAKVDVLIAHDADLSGPTLSEYSLAPVAIEVTGDEPV